MKLPAGGCRPACTVECGTDTARQCIVAVDVLNVLHVGRAMGQLAPGLDQVAARGGQPPGAALIDDRWRVRRARA